jgi:hypothetical protein
VSEDDPEDTSVCVVCAFSGFFHSRLRPLICVRL